MLSARVCSHATYAGVKFDSSVLSILLNLTMADTNVPSAAPPTTTKSCLITILIGGFTTAVDLALVLWTHRLPSFPQSNLHGRSHLLLGYTHNDVFLLLKFDRIWLVNQGRWNLILGFVLGIHLLVGGGGFHLRFVFILFIECGKGILRK